MLRSSTDVENATKKNRRTLAKSAFSGVAYFVPTLVAHTCEESIRLVILQVLKGAFQSESRPNKHTKMWKSTKIKEHDTLTKSKLLEILQTVEKNKKVEILEHSVSPGTETGENFCSEIARCDIVARIGKEVKEYHWIVKLEPILTEFTEGQHVEEKEITYYQFLMSEWNKLAEEKMASFRITNFDSPFAELGKKGKRSILVMENLCHHGYTDAPNKKKGLSLDHIKVALEELARFHSLGYVYLKSYPNGLEEGRRKNEVFITDYMTAETASGAQVLFKRLSDEIINTVGLIQEPGQDFVSIYQRFRDENDPYKFIQRLLRAKPDAFNVICHGDVWFNNMLFKYECLIFCQLFVN